MKRLLLFALLAVSSRSSTPDVVLQSGHGANISALAFSPGGNFLATASEDATIRLWDPPSGAELRVLRGHSNIVTALTISSDGARIASASLDHTLRVWNSATGEQLASFRGPAPAVYLLKLTPDANSLVTVETVPVGSIVRVWDIRTGRQTRAIKRDDAAVSYVFFAHNGADMLVAEESGDDEPAGMITTYQLPGGRSIARRSALLCGASDDGGWLALDQSNENGRKASILDVSTNKAVATLAGQVSKVAFSSNGEWLAYESIDGNAAVVQRTSGGSARTIRGRSAEFSMLAISPDGRLLATAGADYSIHLWDVATGRLAHGMPGQSTPSVLAFSPDGRLLAANGGGTDLGAALQVWDIERRAQVNAPRLKRTVTGIAFSADALSLALNTPGLEIFDRRSNASLRRLNCNDAAVFSGNGKWLAANCAGVVTVWPAGSSAEGFHFGEPGDTHTGPLLFNAEGNLLAAGSASGVNVYDVASRKSVIGIKTRDPVSALAFSGETLDVGTHASLYAVDIHTHRKLWSAAAGQWIYALKYAKAGRTLLVLTGSLSAYDAAAGRPAKTLLAKVPGPASAAFSPNAEWLAVGTNSGASLWRLRLE